MSGRERRPAGEADLDLGSRPGNAGGLRVDEALCRACRRCLARQACKVRAIVQIDPGEPPFVDGARCYGCRVCMPACPFGAIAAGPGAERAASAA